MLGRIIAFTLFVLVPPRTWAQDDPAPGGPERYAVVIGVADYVDPRIPDVPHAIADAKAIRDWLTTVGGVSPEHLALLLDEGSTTLDGAAPGEPVANTRENALEVLGRWLPEHVKPDDQVFVYFSGQATAEGDRPVLLPRDARDPLALDTGLDARSIGAAVESLGGVPVLWLDTSFAGRGVAYGPGLATLEPGALSTSARRVVWMAAPPDTVAAEAADAPHGAFTRALLQSFRRSDGRIGRTEVLLTQSARPAPWVDRTVTDRFALSGGGAAAHRPEVVPQSGHGDTVTALAWHPVRPWLASGDATGMVQITDVDARAIRLRLPSGRRGVFRLAFTPDGETLVVAGRDGVLRAWRTSDGEARWAHPISRFDLLRSLAVHDDVVAVGTSRGFVVLVDAETGERRTRFRIGDAPDELGPATTEALAWTDGATHLVSGGDNGELSLWFRGDGTLSRFSYQRRLLGPGPAIRDLAVLGPRVAVAFETGEVQLVPLPEGPADPEVQATLASNGYAVRRIAGHPSGDRVAVAADDIRVWTIEEGTLEEGTRTLPVSSPASSLAWTLDGAQLVSGHEDGTLVLWNDAGQEIGRLPGQAAGVRRLAVEHGRLMVAGEAGATLWDLERGQLVQRLRTDGADEAIAAITLVPSAQGTDEDWVVGGSDAGRLYAWTASTGEVRRRWPLEAAIRDVARSDDALVAITDHFVERITPDERRRWATRAKRPVLGAVPCGPGGRLVVQTERGFRPFDVESGERLGRRRRGGEVLACSPDGAQIAIGRASGAVVQFDATDHRRETKLDRPFALGDLAGTFLGDNRVTGIAYHPEEPLLATSRIGDAARVWDLETRRSILLDTFGTTAIAFAPGRLVVTGSSDGLVQFWDLDTGVRIASLVSLGDEWLAWTPDGLFDGSLQGQRDLFRWRIGDTLHPPSKFHRGFYEPGLLAAIGRGERPRAQRDIADLAPPPIVTIVSPEPGSQTDEGTITVEIAVEDQGGGISDPRLYVNGHRVTTTTGRGLAQPTRRGPAGERVRFRVRLAEGRNHLRATAFNADGNWESLGAEGVVEWTAPPTEPPKLHVLAVGIDRYQNRRLDLDFARDDADAIGGFFEPGLFGEVVPYVLLDDEASLASIRQAFERVAASADPRDALLVYLAGHGVLEGEVFHFLPWDAAVGSTDEITATGFSQTELGDRLASIHAMKQLIVLDACHSGAASQALASLVGRRSTPGVVRAQSRLARSTGAFLIAASTEAQVAHEIPELGHGVLTYAILRGLGEDGPPEAHVDRDGNVTVNTLIQYVSDLVPVLTDTYRQQRQEVVQAADGQDFPLVAP